MMEAGVDYRTTLDELREARERCEELRAALMEIHRRTGLLIHQNIGHWDTRIEHDARTMGVLSVNQEIARDVLFRGNRPDHE